jgi:hypothetical protein
MNDKRAPSRRSRDSRTPSGSVTASHTQVDAEKPDPRREALLTAALVDAHTYRLEERGDVDASATAARRYFDEYHAVCSMQSYGLSKRDAWLQYQLEFCRRAKAITDEVLQVVEKNDQMIQAHLDTLASSLRKDSGKPGARTSRTVLSAANERRIEQLRAEFDPEEPAAIVRRVAELVQRLQKHSTRGDAFDLGAELVGRVATELRLLSPPFKLTPGRMGDARDRFARAMVAMDPAVPLLAVVSAVQEAADFPDHQAGVAHVRHVIAPYVPAVTDEQIGAALVASRNRRKVGRPAKSSDPGPSKEAGLLVIARLLGRPATKPESMRREINAARSDARRRARALNEIE